MDLRLDEQRNARVQDVHELRGVFVHTHEHGVTSDAASGPRRRE
jgi:hypothetical protein